LDRNESLVEYFISGNDLYIFVLRQDALVSVERRGVIDQIRNEFEAFERHVESCSVKWERLAAVRHHLDATAKNHLKTLYSHLISPVEKELRALVITAPHGFLHGVPFHALQDGEHYLGEQHQVAYTPSASLYCIPQAVTDYAGSLFIAFSGSSTSVAIEEVEESAANAAGATVLINPSIDQLCEAFSVPRELVHIAGHAGIDTVSGKLSWIETSGGRITSRDLTNMQICARTIIITGCQTARRLIQPGDEWLGLMRSFYLSGASTIISALWDIRDESARRFARELYKSFDGHNAPAAVQRASAALRQWRGHPYFWAAFGTFIRKSD
jgi:CHAT domain-containing protein